MNKGLSFTLVLSLLFSMLCAQKPELGLPLSHRDAIIHMSFSKDGKYKGRYSINGSEVDVRGRLFKGKGSLGDIQVSGKKEALPALVEAIIIDKVSGMIR